MLGSRAPTRGAWGHSTARVPQAPHKAPLSDVPKGGPRGTWPLPERPQGAPQAPKYVF